MPTHHLRNGIPLLLVLRDLLKVVHTRREARLILREGKVLVNGKKASDEKFSLVLFDLLSLEGKHYRIVLNERGKFALDSGKERIAKIIGKTLLAHGQTQIHLSNGWNYLANEQYTLGDSVVLGEQGPEKVAPLKEGSKILVISGKLSGLHGKIEKVGRGFATVSSEHKHHIIKLENIMVLP